MKFNLLLVTGIASFLFFSCSSDQTIEDLKEIEQLETLTNPVDISKCIDAEEVTDEDT